MLMGRLLDGFLCVGARESGVEGGAVKPGATSSEARAASPDTLGVMASALAVPATATVTIIDSNLWVANEIGGFVTSCPVGPSGAFSGTCSG